MKNAFRFVVSGMSLGFFLSVAFFENHFIRAPVFWLSLGEGKSFFIFIFFGENDVEVFAYKRTPGYAPELF